MNPLELEVLARSLLHIAIRGIEADAGDDRLAVEELADEIRRGLDREQRAV
jgi:hypothetical protein